MLRLGQRRRATIDGTGIIVGPKHARQPDAYPAHAAAGRDYQSHPLQKLSPRNLSSAVRIDMFHDHWPSSLLPVVYCLSKGGSWSSTLANLHFHTRLPY